MRSSSPDIGVSRIMVSPASVRRRSSKAFGLEEDNKALADTVKDIYDADEDAG